MLLKEELFLLLISVAVAVLFVIMMLMLMLMLMLIQSMRSISPHCHHVSMLQNCKFGWYDSSVELVDIVIYSVLYRTHCTVYTLNNTSIPDEIFADVAISKNPRACCPAFLELPREDSVTHLLLRQKAL